MNTAQVSLSTFLSISLCGESRIVHSKIKFVCIKLNEKLNRYPLKYPSTVFIYKDLFQKKGVT